MDDRTIKKGWIVLALAALVAAGCSTKESVMPHTADEQKAYNAFNAMTPQQHIDAIEKGPMPPAAKAKMIQDIKDKAGMK